ncbi:MAG: SCP2 sterol-binding domain-containing protein [Oscillospiraceae bacterium]|nr:SCP2 sterol-binding domain-containing protein [Oscillospiraceae bacterium]
MAKNTTKTKKPAQSEALTYDTIIDAFRQKVAKATAPVDACVATQITLYGSVEGVLYIVIANGIAKVEPFDYKGADIEVDADADTFMSVLSGNKALSTAIAEGDIKMQGNAGKAIILGTTAFFHN